MKTNLLKSVLFLALSLGSFTSCVNDDDYSIPNINCVEPNIISNRTVQEIYQLASPNVKQYANTNILSPAGDYLEAYVVSSDKGGNFFKSLSLQTVATASTPAIGFSVPIDVVSLFSTYEPGRKVYVRLNNRYFNITNSSLVIGEIFINATSGAASVGRLSPFAYGNIVVRGCEIKNEEELVTYATVTEALSDAKINTLVEITDVQFEDSALGQNYFNPNNVLGGATNHRLVDADGNNIIFRTSSFANYAGRPVAEGRGSVRGVLTKFGNDYQFVARTIEDVKLDGPRLSPLYSENFESVTTGTTAFISLPGWSNVAMNGGNVRWTGRVFSNNKYAQMSAFNSNDNNVDARLITPGIDLAGISEATFKFGYKTGFANGVAVSVWYSTNYDGSGTAAAINAATWTQFAPLTVQDTQYATNFYPVSYDLTPVAGQTVYVAFRYQGASNGITSTYQIDNIEVIGN
jgi:hypothetical protein